MALIFFIIYSSTWLVLLIILTVILFFIKRSSFPFNRKDLKKIEFDFNYDFNEKKVYFDNLRLDNKTNENLDKFISKFNSSDEKFFNTITFKSFVKKVFEAYFG